LTPTRIHTKAAVKFEKVEGGFSITNIELTVEAEIPGTDAAAFEQFAETAKANCPVSRALAGTHITLRSTLL
jgi:osmotically inducible protein OsmC